MTPASPHGESNEHIPSKDLEDIGEVIFKIGTALEGLTREEAQQVIIEVTKRLGIQL